MGTWGVINYNGYYKEITQLDKEIILRVFSDKQLEYFSNHIKIHDEEDDNYKTIIMFKYSDNRDISNIDSFLNELKIDITVSIL